MMDELRFRAYDRRRKRIYYVEKIDRSLLNKGWFVWGKSFQNGRRKNILLGVSGVDCDLLVFTGLKDRKGKDIYGGHILKYILPAGHGPDDNPDIYVVEWGEYGFEARWANPPSPRVHSDGHLSLRDADKDMEIIGTIYENPELIKAFTKDGYKE